MWELDMATLHALAHDITQMTHINEIALWYISDENTLTPLT